jgi:hypothetical protein
VGALLALAFDHTVAHQAIDPRAGLAITGARISREIAVQDSHSLDSIFCTISASVLRALTRCGSLQARSVTCGS